MSLDGLIVALSIALALRLFFLVAHLHDLQALWSDYEQRGFRYRLAQGVDWSTLGLFAALVFIALYKIHSLNYPLTMTFVGIFGLQILNRFRISRFPQTNLPDAFFEAKISLMVHVLLSIAGAAGFTLVTAIYLWLNK